MWGCGSKMEAWLTGRVGWKDFYRGEWGEGQGYIWAKGYMQGWNMLFPSNNITTPFPISVCPSVKGCSFHQWKDVLPTTQACNLWVIFESEMHRILELSKVLTYLIQSLYFSDRDTQLKEILFSASSQAIKPDPMLHLRNPYQAFLPLIHLALLFPSPTTQQTSNPTFGMSLSSILLLCHQPSLGCT